MQPDFMFPSPEYPQSDNVDNQDVEFRRELASDADANVLSHPLTRK